MVARILVILIAALAALPARAAADVRTFTPARVSGASAVFDLRGLDAAGIHAATLRIESARRPLSLTAVRRAARRGVLRVRVARGARASLQVTTCARSASAYATSIRRTPGLVGYWSLGERSGRTVCDDTRRAAGVYAGAVALGRGGAIAGGDSAAVFGGTGQVTVRFGATRVRGRGWSIEAWVKPDVNGSRTVIHRPGQYTLRVGGGVVRARLELTAGRSVTATGASGSVPGAFQHVAVTYDGSRLRVYRDAVEIAASPARGIPAASRAALAIGAGFNGAVDEFALYERALTREQLHGRVAAAQPPTPHPPSGPGATCPWEIGAWPPACWRPFAPTSPFNVPIPPNPRVLENSGAIVQRFLDFDQITPLWVGTADTPDDFGHPTYYARASDPRYTLRCRGEYFPMPIEGDTIHIPGGVRPAGGSDGHMAVVQPDGALYELYEAEPITAGGGVVYANGGGRTTITGSGVGVPNGATSAKFAVPAGVIRASEMEAGEIRHALFIAVRCVDGTFVAPARGRARSCGAIGESNTNAPPNGARLQLALDDAEIERLTVPPWKKTILRAMARYGLYVGDTGGGFIHPESGSSYTSFGHTDPWETFAERRLPEGGITTWISSRDGKRDYALDIESGVPWERLQVIDPCVTQGTC